MPPLRPVIGIFNIVQEKLAFADKDTPGCSIDSAFVFQNEFSVWRPFRQDGQHADRAGGDAGGWSFGCHIGFPLAGMTVIEEKTLAAQVALLGHP